MFDIASLDATHWLCEPTALKRIIAQVRSFDGCYDARQLAKIRRRRLDAAARPDTIQTSEVSKTSEVYAGPKAIRAQSGRIGIIGVHGPIDQHVTSALEKAGGTSCDEMGAALDTLMADSTVSAIVMHVDSPGGSVAGVGELCDKIYAARATKPVYCSIDSLGASAAYWIACAADTVTMTPGGYCGSVGVYSIHVDQTAAMEAQGIKVSMVHAGRYKVEFVETAALTDDARAYLQSVVDGIYDRFTGAVAKCRGVTQAAVKADYGQGRVCDAPTALAAGMIDRVMTFEDLLGKLTGGGSSRGQRQAAASAPSLDVLRLRHAWQKQRAAERPAIA